MFQRTKEDHNPKQNLQNQDRQFFVQSHLHSTGGTIYAECHSPNQTRLLLSLTEKGRYCLAYTIDRLCIICRMTTRPDDMHLLHFSLLDIIISVLLEFLAGTVHSPQKASPLVPKTRPA